MHDLESIDLNQLRILASLLATHSVTRTALQLGMSQSGVSRTLKDLRQVFADPLLVKTNTGMTLTQRAESLRLPLDQWQSATRHVLRNAGAFAMTSPSGPIRVASTDYGVMSVLGPTLPAILEQAPGLQVEVCELPPDNINLLSSGAVDVVISGFDPEPARTYEKHLFRETYCCIFNAAHPLAAQPHDQPITVEELLAWPHLIPTVHGVDIDPFGRSLKAEQAVRRVAVRLPYFVSAVTLLPSTQAILISPVRVYENLFKAAGMVARPALMDLGHFDYWLYWHERNRRDHAVMWFVDAISRQFSDTDLKASI